MLLNVDVANSPSKLLTTRKMEFHRHSEMILSLVQDWLVGGKHTDVSVAVIEDGTIYSIR